MQAAASEAVRLPLKALGAMAILISASWQRLAGPKKRPLKAAFVIKWEWFCLF